MKKLVTSLVVGLFVLMMSSLQSATAKDISSTEPLSNEAMVPTIFHLDGGNYNTGDQVCLELTVEDFDALNGFQYSLVWNKSVLRFDSVEAASISINDYDPSFFTLVSPDTLITSWANFGVNAVTLPDGEVLARICFTAIGPGTANFRFPENPLISDPNGNSNPYPRQVIDENVDIAELDADALTTTVTGPPIAGCGNANEFAFFAGHEAGLNGDQVCIDITAEEFINLITFQWSFVFDSTIIRYDTAIAVNLPDFNADDNVAIFPQSDRLTVAWFKDNGVGVTIPDCEPLFQLCFEVVGQLGENSPVEFSDAYTSIEVRDEDGNLLNPSFFNGSVTVGTPTNGPTFRVLASDRTVEEGNQTCVDVTANGFTDITDFEYSMAWNEGVIDYVNVQNFGVTGLDASAFDVSSVGSGDLSVSWSAPGGTPVTLANGTRLYSVCYSAIGAPGNSSSVSFPNTPVAPFIRNADMDTLNFSSRTGTVNIVSPPGDCGSIDTLSFYMGNESVMPGEQVCLPVRVSQFVDIVSFQFSINYNEALLQYDTALAGALPGFDFNNVFIPQSPPGALTINWLEPGNAFDGETIPECETAFYLCFTALGPDGTTVPVDFSADPTPVEVSDADGNIIMTSLAGFENGAVTIEDNAGPGKPNFRVTSNTVTVEEGELACLNVSVSGFNNITEFQYSNSWDENLLTFDNVRAFNLNGLTAANFDLSNTASGQLSLSWDAPGGTPVTLANGTKIYETCFTADGPAGSTANMNYTGNPLSRLAVDADNDTLNFTSQRGTVNIISPPGACGSIDTLSFYLGHETVMPGEQVCLPVTVSQFTDIVSFQFSINYDEALLAYDTVLAGALPGFNFNNVFIPQSPPGALTINWLEPGNAFDGETLAECEVAFYLCFTALGPDGTDTPVEFSEDPTPVEVSDADGQIIMRSLAGFENGSVKIMDNVTPTKPDFRVSSNTTTVEEGDMTCLNVTVRGFNNITKFQYSNSWDEALLDFVNVRNFNLAGLTAGNFNTSNTANGELSMTWQAPGGTPVTLANGTKIYETCFTATGPAGTTTNMTFTGTPVSRLAVDADNDTLNFTSQRGTVNIISPPGACGSLDTLSFYLGNEVVPQPGDVACLPVTVSQFTDIVSFQFSINFDTSMLEYDSAYAGALPGFDVNNVFIPQSPPGALTINWLEPGNAFDGETLPECEIAFYLCFRAKGDPGSVTPVEFSDDPTPVEVSDKDGQIVMRSLAGFENGSVEVDDGTPPTKPPFTISQTDESVQEGNQVCLDVTVNGFTNVERLNFSQSWDPTVLEFSTAQNFNLAGLDINDFSIDAMAGTYSVEWTTSPGVTLANGIKIYEVCFNAVGNAGDMSDVSFGDAPLPRLVVDGDGDTLTFQQNDGSITIEQGNTGGGDCDCAADPATELSLYTSEADVLPDSTVCVEITAKQFIDVVSFQFSVGYDHNLLEFVDADAPILPGFDGNNVFFPSNRDGVLTINWLEPGNSFDGETVPDCEVLFRLCFRAIGPMNSTSVIDLTNDPTPVEVSDADGMVILNDTLTFCDGAVNITDGGTTDPQCMVPAPAITNVACRGGNNGRIDFTIPMGTMLNFQWADGTMTEDRNNLAAGNYTVTVSGQGCTSVTRTYSVMQPATALNTAVDTVINNACYVGMNGAISVSATGGWGTYTYRWTPMQNGMADITGLQRGSYTVTITDSGLCRDTLGPIEIISPPQLRIQSSLVGDVSCAGFENGIIQLNVTGGTPDTGYVYTWSAGLPGVPTHTDLPAGDYFVTIEDANGCSIRDTFVVNTSPAIAVQVNSITQANQGPNGAIDITPQNGTSPYMFSWTGPDNYTAGSEDISGLFPGDYVIIITDALGCESAPDTITVPGRNRTDNATATRTCPGSSDGSIMITTTGYDNPSISWNGPGNPTGFNPTGLQAGTYTYRIFDNGTLQAGPTDVIVGTHPPVTINESVTDERLGMNDGAIQLQLTGGVGPFSYNWNPVLPSQPNVTDLSAGVYNVTVTDDGTGCSYMKSITVDEILPVSIISLTPNRTSCNGENDGTINVRLRDGEPNFVIRVDGSIVATVSTRNYVITGLAAGTYTIDITDGNGLTAGPMMVTVTEPDPFTHNLVSIPRTDDDLGRIDLTVNGGTPPYSFNWSNGATTEDLFDLREGCYRCTVTDSKGCIFITDDECIGYFRITSSNIVNVTCPGDQNGSIMLQVFGGNEPYDYTWKNEFDEIVGVDSNLIGVPAGVYTVEIRGTLGTVTTRPFTIRSRSNISADALPLTNFGGYNVTCADATNGRARVTAINGVVSDSTYSYLWDNGARTRTIDNLPAGTYMVTVTDNLGCEAEASVDILAPPPVISNFSATNPTCFGDSNGSISIFPDGGVGEPYNFEWNDPGRTSPTIRNLPDGLYTVTITDGNDCEMVEVIELVEPTEVTGTMVTTDDNGSNTGTATVIPQGGTAPYSFEWNTNATVNPLLNIPAGPYICQITDDNGCTAIVEGYVGSGEIACLTSRAVITPNGDGLNEELIFWCLENYQQKRLQIFNRWGQLVFETDDYNNDWAGTNRRGNNVPEGAYFFILEYAEGGGAVQQLKGSFTLLRE